MTRTTSAGYMVCTSNLRKLVLTGVIDSTSPVAACAVSKDVALCGGDNGLSSAPTVKPNAKIAPTKATTR